MKVHPVFNTVKLRPALEDTITGRKAPARVVVGNAPEWKVEYIKNSRLQRRKLEYLVKWKDYPQEESIWEPAENLKNSRRLVNDFHNKHSSAPRRISALIFSRLSFKPYINFTVRATCLSLQELLLRDWSKAGREILSIFQGS